MQQSNSDQSYSDEIDLADLVRSLWNGKWLVIGVTFVTVVLAVAYLKLTPKTYTGTLAISALKSVEADIYSELNDTNFISVDEQVLRSMFIEDIQSYNSIEQFIKSYGYVEQQKGETDTEYALRLRSAAYGFALVPPTLAAGKNFQPNWLLNITTKNPDMASQIIIDAFTLSNGNVNQQLTQTFQRRRDAKVRQNKFAIAEFEFKKQRALGKYETRKAAHLALLHEQGQIAHSLNLSNGSLSAQSYANTSTVVTSVAGDEPLYLRGYLALEKEIEMIEARKSPEPFIPQLEFIEDLKLQLLQDQTLIRADELLAITPIGTEHFVAAHYDLASMEYKSKTKFLLVLALAVVLGGMLGIFVLLIRNALIKKD